MEIITFNRPRQAVVLDVDGVLLPCAELGVARWNKEHPDEEPMTIEEITGYGVLGKRTDEILPYYAREEFYHDQRPYPGAQEFVKELCRLYDVYFLTAVPDNVVKYRGSQLKRFFPEVGRDHVFYGSVKERFIADFSLDDSPDHILAQYESGSVKHPVIMRRPWNEDLSGIMSLTDYNDFLTFIKLVNGIKSSFEPKKNEGSRVVAMVGPAGSDKGRLVSAMIDRGFERLPSYTTAEKRDDEPKGYIHVSVDEFRRLKDEGRFIESTSYCMNYYGISRTGVEDALKYNLNIVTVVDICGAVTLKRLFSERCLTVYVTRDETAVYQDIMAKHTGSELINRLRWLSAEKKNKELCDITVLNDDVAAAADALTKYITGK